MFFLCERQGATDRRRSDEATLSVCKWPSSSPRVLQVHPESLRTFPRTSGLKRSGLVRTGRLIWCRIFHLSPVPTSVDDRKKRNSLAWSAGVMCAEEQDEAEGQIRCGDRELSHWWPWTTIHITYPFQRPCNADLHPKTCHRRTQSSLKSGMQAGISFRRQGPCSPAQSRLVVL